MHHFCNTELPAACMFGGSNVLQADEGMCEQESFKGIHLPSFWQAFQEVLVSKQNIHRATQQQLAPLVRSLQVTSADHVQHLGPGQVRLWRPSSSAVRSEQTGKELSSPCMDASDAYAKLSPKSEDNPCALCHVQALVLHASLARAMLQRLQEQLLQATMQARPGEPVSEGVALLVRRFEQGLGPLLLASCPWPGCLQGDKSVPAFQPALGALKTIQAACTMQVCHLMGFEDGSWRPVYEASSYMHAC